MTPLEEAALYTPLIQFFIIYVYAYRHDLPRLFHPKAERTGLRAWADVLLHLRLTEKSQCISEQTKVSHILMIFLVAVGLPSSLLSIFEPLLVAGSVIDALQLPLLFFLQFIPAVLALAILEKRIGPRPLSPYNTIIPDSYGSSLTRHLSEKVAQAT